MKNSILSPATKTALQNFLQIWEQDPLAQQTLCIAPQNIFICDTQNIDQITDITNELKELLSIDNNTQDEQRTTLGETSISVDTNKTKEKTPNSKDIQEIIDNLTQLLKLGKSHPNLFLAQNWQDQLEKIVQQLKENRKSKKGCIRMLEAYYYLGKLIEENISYDT
jgi:hypothetical protein